MKIIAFGASSSKQSINKALASYAASLIPGAETEVLDLNNFDMPLFSEDREKDIGQHPLAQKFLDKIATADALIVSFAEHNGSYSAAYKNVFDWASRIDTKVFQGKHSLWLSTSPGPGGASRVLASAVDSAPHFKARLVGHLSVPSFYDHFDRDANELTSPEIKRQLLQRVNALADTVREEAESSTLAEM